MGNAVVERATLPMGYVPIGIKEYNGIVYVVAYNPLEQRVQFGSFPSPEIDFNGEDFDPEEYELEGVRFSTPDFYTLNEKYPTYAPPDPPDNQAFEDAVSAILPTADVIDSIWNDNNPFGIMYWDDFGPFGPDGLPNKYDAWTLQTDGGEQKFKIQKSDVVESFESYEWLRLNPGDRFLIYHVDIIDQDDYSNVTEILQHYISTPGTPRLFKVEVFSVSEDGSKTKLNIDPFLYRKEDTDLNILNGDLEENVTYTVFDGESNSIIEIKISLERPEKFTATFKQYTSIANAVRFKTTASSLSFMQIKGFKYDIRKKIVNPDDPEDVQMVITGYMRYQKKALYDNFKQKSQIKSYVELRDLPFGTYDFIITPYTQFGYEYSLIVTGSFTVSEFLIQVDEDIVVETYNWNANMNTGTFHLNLNTTFNLIDSQSVSSGYLELYDVWSNVSKIIDVFPVELTGEMSFSEDFSLSIPGKSKIFNTTIFGGIPSNLLEYNQSALLPSRTISYQGNKNQFISSALQLSPNRFYVLALYYMIEDEDTGATIKKGIYRYFYTNDVLNDQGLLDYSEAIYPETMIELTKGTLTTTIPNSTEMHATNNGINDDEYLLDPLMQTFNAQTLQVNATNKKPYIIQPKEYFDSYYSNALIKQKYFKYVWFKLYQNITHGINMQNNPGILNCTNETTSAIIIIPPQNKNINQNQSLRTVTSYDGSNINTNDILDTVETQQVNYSVIYSEDETLKFLTYGYPHKLNANIGYDYTESNISYTNHLMPLYYSASKEIITKLINCSAENINLALTSKTLALELYSSGQAINNIPPPKMLINSGGFGDYLNTQNYCNDGGRGRFVEDCFRGYANSFYENLIATPANPPQPADFQNNYTLGFKNDNNTGCQFMFDKYDLTANQIDETLYGLRCLDDNRLLFLAFNNSESYSNLINPLFFVGGYQPYSSLSIPNNQQYKLYDANTSKRTQESETSKLIYDVTTTMAYTVLNKSCYRIFMPAINTLETVILENSIIKSYIENQFDNFQIYDGGNLIPMQQERSQREITYGSNIDIPCGFVPGELEFLNTLDSQDYVNDHPTMNSTILNTKYLVQTSNQNQNGIFFDRNARELNTSCNKLYTLSNVNSPCEHLIYSPTLNQLAFNNTWNTFFTGLSDYYVLSFYYLDNFTPSTVLKKYNLY